MTKSKVSSKKRRNKSRSSRAVCVTVNEKSSIYPGILRAAAEWKSPAMNRGRSAGLKTNMNK